MTDGDDERVAERLAALGIEAGGWTHELDRLDEEGVPVQDLQPTTRGLMLEMQGRAARLSGMGLYNVTLRFERVLADDKDEAIDKAEAGYGPLVERRVELVYDPEGVGRVAGEPSAAACESPLERSSPGYDPDVPPAEFMRLIDELCIDPVTGETVLPDYVLISDELYKSIVEDPRCKLLRPGDELTFFEFPLRVVSHEELQAVSGTDAHVLVFDRRETIQEVVDAWDGPDEGWDEAVRRTVEP